MSKCEHGEPISLFCISDTCNWREAGGCQNCLKKYHTHVQNIDTINLQKLEQLVNIFNVNPEIKVKTKLLQEAVCNYFIIMKSQINTSLDAVSRTITNKLNYPYLCSQGHLTAFRKIKNKQFKKLTKKQLKNFCNFVNTQNKELVQFNERKIYHEQVVQVKDIFKNINDAFLTYSRAVEKIDNAFNVQKSFFNKVLEITSAIQHSEMKQQQKKQKKLLLNNRNNFQPEQNIPKDNKIINSRQTNLSNINKKNSNDRNRKVSIDAGINMDLNKFISSPVNQNFDQNEKQIYQRKKKLFQMLNSPHHAKSTQIKKIQEQKSNQILENNLPSVQKTTLSKQTPQQHKHVHMPQQRQIASSAQKQSLLQQITQSKSTQINSQLESKLDEKQIKKQQQQKYQNPKFDIFEDLMNKGINLPQLIAHTILPRQASKQKLYQDTKDVKQRKIVIPVKQFHQQQQNSSPLLKKKRQRKRQVQEQGLKQQNSKDMNKINLFESIDQNAKDQIYCPPEQIVDQQLSPVKKPKQDQKMLLKDKEADSLALLLQSLPLSAQKAIPILEAALKFAYNNLSAAQYLSYLYLEIQKPKQCLELCNKILEQLEDSPQANQLTIHLNNNKAAALNMLGRYSQSINILEKCITHTKKDIYYKNLGDAYFSIAIYQKASINYENAIKLNSNMDQAYYNLAVCYYLQQHLHQAQLNVTKALKINPKNEEYLRLGRQIMIKLQL